MKIQHLLPILFLVVPGFANALERQTLLGAGSDNGGMGGVVMKGTEINNSLNLMVGGKGAWILDNRFYMGGGGFGSTQGISTNDNTYELGMGGVMVGYLFRPHRLVHIGSELMLGAGGITERHRYDDAHDEMNQHGDAFFFAEPSLFAAFNVAPHCKIHTGLSYRYIDGTNTAGLSDSDLKNFNVEVSVLFGKF